jgi:hypothetical protein
VSEQSRYGRKPQHRLDEFVQTSSSWMESGPDSMVSPRYVEANRHLFETQRQRRDLRPRIDPCGRIPHRTSLTSLTSDRAQSSCISQTDFAWSADPRAACDKRPPPCGLV